MHIKIQETSHHGLECQGSVTISRAEIISSHVCNVIYLIFHVNCTWDELKCSFSIQ